MLFLCTPVYALALGTLLLFAPPFGLVELPYFFDPNSYERRWSARGTSCAR